MAEWWSPKPLIEVQILVPPQSTNLLSKFYVAVAFKREKYLKNSWGWRSMRKILENYFKI